MIQCNGSRQGQGFRQQSQLNFHLMEVMSEVADDCRHDIFIIQLARSTQKYLTSKPASHKKHLWVMMEALFGDWKAAVAVACNRVLGCIAVAIGTFLTLAAIVEDLVVTLSLKSKLPFY